MITGTATTHNWHIPKRTDKLGSEKNTLGFFADILYLQGIIPIELYERIQSVKYGSDLDNIVQEVLDGDYDACRRTKPRTYVLGQRAKHD